jgi:hypothetical protein
MSVPVSSGSEIFYKMVQDREITVTHRLSMYSKHSYWVAVNIDHGPDQHAFSRISLHKAGELHGKVHFIMWHFKDHDDKGAGVGVKECEPPDEIWDPASVSDLFHLMIREPIVIKFHRWWQEEIISLIVTGIRST